MNEEDLSSMMLGLDQLSMVIETVVGYRAKCLAAGFSETAAELMALELHSMLMRGAIPHAS